jgi:hypothetical protein
MLARIFLPALLALASSTARGAEQGYTAKALDLLERPQAEARVLTRLAKRQPLQLVGRAGSWVNVRARDSAGWMRLADLRLNAAAAPAPASRPTGTAGKKAGIRGFSEEELVIGAPNHAESERLRRAAVSVREAVSFARAANLHARRQDYIQMLDFMPEGGFPKEFFDE